MTNSLDRLTAYIPLDRRQEMAGHRHLPEHVHGAAIFADIDGFTALTERLVGELGPQRGAEELTGHLNRVYDAVIDVLHHYGASVIAFAGDAVTSWLDGDDGRRATACGLAIRQAMKPLASVTTPGGGLISLSVKVVIAAGPARRYRVGDPTIRILDALAGETLVRMAAAESLTRKGEVILDSRTLAGMRELVTLEEERTDVTTGLSCGVVQGMNTADAPTSRVGDFTYALTVEQVRPWLHAPVFTRLQSGLGDFLAELRPTVALFVRFDGIDYDHDEDAGKKLDRYIRWVQQVTARYEGTLIDLNIGDKGSYLYINFGALLAHEDSSDRALSCALDLRRGAPDLAFIEPVQIGISRGRMRVGAYGGRGHRTYGALGTEVNMAARLMMAARPGQVLVSQTVRHPGDHRFAFQPEPPLMLKGRTAAVMAFSLLDAQPARGQGASRSPAAGPMVGRRQELDQLSALLQTAADGHGQLIGIRGDPGVGKSRLVAELLGLAEEHQFDIFGGECPSYGVNSNYLVWQPIWHALLGVDSHWETARQVAALREYLTAIDPALELRHPLLGMLFNMEIPDNELTAALDAKTRKAALESLLVDCLTHAAHQRPMVIHLEDCHWLDSFSQDLIDAVSVAVVDLPVVLVMAFRPPEMERLHRTLGAQLAHYHEFRLSVFDQDEAKTHVELLLGQLYPAPKRVSTALMQRILAKAEGNPFYIVELLTYMRDQGIDPEAVDTVTLLNLPDSLQSLVLSRVDRLPEHQASVLKVASVIGRTFPAEWLCDVHAALGSRQDVDQSLHALTEQEMVTPDPGADASYLFRQTIVQNAIYESLPHTVRTTTHEHVGRTIEKSHRAALDQFLDRLAYHYDLSDNEAKKVTYLEQAGKAAQANYANEAAIDYYQRLLPLVDTTEAVDIHVRLGDVLQLVGRWDEARDNYQAALAVAEQAGDLAGLARGHRAMGRSLYQDRPQEALDWLERGLALAQSIDEAHDGSPHDSVTDVEISDAAFLIDIGWSQIKMGNVDAALEALLAGLGGLPDTASDLRGNALSSLSSIYRRTGDAERALRYAELALQNSREMPNLWQEQIALISLASVYYQVTLNWRETVANFEQASKIAEQIGDKRVGAALAINLGLTHLRMGEPVAADTHLRRGLYLARETHLPEYEFLAQLTLAELATRIGDWNVAQEALSAAETLVDILGTQERTARIARIEAELLLARGEVDMALDRAQHAVALAQEHQLQVEQAISKRVLGQTLIAAGQPESAQAALTESATILHEIDPYEAARARLHLGRARIAAGDSTAGTALLDEVRTIFTNWGAAFDLDEIAP